MYLIVSADYPPVPGGLATATQWAARVLARHVPTAVVTYRPAGWLEVPPSSAWPVLRAPGFDCPLLRPLCLANALYAWLDQRRAAVDHVLAINLTDGGYVGWRLRCRAAVPYTLCAFGFDFLKWSNNRFARRVSLDLYRRAARVLAVSRFTQDALVEWGVPAAKISVCSFGIDLERFARTCDVEIFRRQQDLAERLILLSVGRLVERKGHDRVLEAVACLRSRFPALVYVVVGDGPYRPVLEARAQRLGLERQVRFVGHRPDAELPLWYSSSDLVVQPNRRKGASVEGLGLVFWEAGACGIPVVGGRSGGTPEAIEDGETGCLVDPDNVTELVETLAALLTDPARRKAMGRRAAERIPQRCAQAETVLLTALGLGPQPL